MSRTDWTVALAKSVRTDAQVMHYDNVVHAEPTYTQHAYPIQEAVQTVSNKVTSHQVVEQPVDSGQAMHFQSPVAVQMPVQQPVIPTQMFAPNGIFVLPMQQQCVT